MRNVLEVELIAVAVIETPVCRNSSSPPRTRDDRCIVSWHESWTAGFCKRQHRLEAVGNNRRDWCTGLCSVPRSDNPDIAFPPTCMLSFSRTSAARASASMFGLYLHSPASEGMRMGAFQKHTGMVCERPREFA